MSLELVEKIADAVLYEGYILYPYRSSSVKNRQRFNFGVLVPQSYSVAQGGTEAWSMQTECLVSGDAGATLDMKVRFLHLLVREIREVDEPQKEWREELITESRLVESLEVNGQVYQTWQEAVEREINALNINLDDLIRKPQQQLFSFPPAQDSEPLRDVSGNIVGIIVRRQEAVRGRIEIAAERANGNLYKVMIRVFNDTPFENAWQKSRDEALVCSLASAHTILGVRGGEFVSLLEPPDEFREAAAACQNRGTWPVLVGGKGERNIMLSSPIILYDYPEIAPESAGDLFDGTEIDEILTLRIMTMTDDEKREMRYVDERARRLLERTEALSAEQMMKLHGTMRGLRPLEESRNE